MVGVAGGNAEVGVMGTDAVKTSVGKMTIVSVTGSVLVNMKLGGSLTGARVGRVCYIRFTEISATPILPLQRRWTDDIMRTVS